MGSSVAVGSLRVGLEARTEASSAARTQQRFAAVDILRGISVAGMVLVNNPGSWTDGYGMLTHAEWDGCTIADLVFPLFLFIVGMSSAISLSARLRRGEKASEIVIGVLRRAAILFALGLLLNGFPDFDVTTLRIPGVLQRIALCYGFTGLLLLKAGARGQAIVALSLLAGYWALMTLVAVPGWGAGVLDQEGNLAAHLDRLVLHGHLYHEGWDPEGILSTVPAVATTLFGALAARWTQSPRDAVTSSFGLVAVGSIGVVAGELMDPWFPINKQLWTSSFVLFTSGIAAVLLGVCHWLVDGKGYKRWAAPLLVLGTNALAVYVLSSLLALVLERVTVTPAAAVSESLRLYLFEHLFLPWAGSRNGSLCFAAAYLLAWLLPMAILYRRSVFIRI